jgi:uncharacterized membrane protein YfcA
VQKRVECAAPQPGLIAPLNQSVVKLSELNHDPVFIAIVIALLGFLIGLTKGGFNALGALLTPILSLVLPVSLAVGVLLPMLIAGDVIAVYLYRGQWDTRLVRRMLPTGLVGAVIGTLLLAQLSPNALRIILGVFVLVVVVYKFVGDRITRLAYRPQRWHAPTIGAMTGITSGLFNNGAPAFNSYLLLLKLPSQAFVATGVLFFALINLIKLPGFLIAGVLDLSWLLSKWWVFSFIPLGLWAARWLILRVNQRAFERLIVVLLTASSLLLFAQSR